MKNRIKEMLFLLPAVFLCTGIPGGCGKAGEPAAAIPANTEEQDKDEAYYVIEDSEYDDYEEDEEYYEEDPEELYGDDEELTTEEILELARIYSGAPIAELDQIMDNGNLYIHLYEDMGDHTATIDWYEIDPETLTGTDFEGNTIDLLEPSFADFEGDEGEGVEIADGEYVTDDEYTGELSADGKTLTITTALYEFVNSPSPSYQKQTYVIDVSDSCICEEAKETSFFDSMDLISDYLEGNSGFPITLEFQDNELVRIQFRS